MASDAGTYPDYALVEDAAAEAFGGRSLQRAKDVFDVLLPDEATPGRHYGMSCKLKENDATRRRQGRVYIEYSNADAKFLAAIAKVGFTKQELLDHEAPADVCGKAIIDVARRWHAGASTAHKGLRPGEWLDVDRSVHLVLSYTWNPADPRLFDYHLYVWPHLIAQVDLWRYGTHSLRGYESAEMLQADEPLYTYNYKSGGHLKWYPKAASATYCYGPVTLRPATQVRLQDRARIYFPGEWPE